LAPVHAFVPNASSFPDVVFLHCVEAATVHAASVEDFCPVLASANAIDNLVVVLQLVALTAAQVASFAVVHEFVPISICAPDEVCLHLVSAQVATQVPSVIDFLTFSPLSASTVLSVFLQFPLPRAEQSPLVAVVHP